MKLWAISLQKFAWMDTSQKNDGNCRKISKIVTVVVIYHLSFVIGAWWVTGVPVGQLLLQFWHFPQWLSATAGGTLTILFAVENKGTVLGSSSFWVRLGCRQAATIPTCAHAERTFTVYMAFTKNFMQNSGTNDYPHSAGTVTRSGHTNDE